MKKAFKKFIMAGLAAGLCLSAGTNNIIVSAVDTDSGESTTGEFPSAEYNSENSAGEQPLDDGIVNNGGTEQQDSPKINDGTIQEIQETEESSSNQTENLENNTGIYASSDTDVASSKKIEKTDPSGKEEKSSDEGITPFSMIQIPEVEACLVLNGIAEEELKNYPVSEILKELVDKNGNPISIDSTATVVWTHVKDERGNTVRDEYIPLGNDKTVDLTDFEYSTGYTMEMIVGSGKQLDEGNVRYIVRVFISNKLRINLTPEVYAIRKDGTVENLGDPWQTATSVLASYPVTTNYFKDPKESETERYVMNLTSTADDHPYYQSGVFKLIDSTDITHQIMSQNVTTGGGYSSDILVSDLGDTEKMLNGTFLYTVSNSKTGQYVDQRLIQFAVVKSDKADGTGKFNVYSKKDEHRESIVNYYQTNINTTQGRIYRNDVIFLKSDFTKGTYYLNLELTDSLSREIVRIVKDQHTYEEAMNLPDVKETLATSGEAIELEEADSGYESVYTIVLQNGTTQVWIASVLKYSSEVDSMKNIDFFEEPIYGQADPWLRVTGAADKDGKTLETYAIQNGKKVNVDTMYGYGYQTLLIDDNTVDSVVPVIEMANADKVKVSQLFLDSKPYNIGDSIPLKGMETRVVLTAYIEDSKGIHPKNYNVLFVKKAKGPKLFVADPKGNGPDDTVRSVFLDEYSEHKHDILIANMGDEPLTGLKVELNATNVKLDDYWTVGGEKNSTLQPFSSTESKSDYSVLNNVAKIRLVPDGDARGNIEGTLTISADGQDPVIIKLSGRAQEPGIVVSELDSAVKYVPYSQLVQTNNMYDWTKVSFKLDGTLPEGLQFYQETGEIYGVPQTAGSYTFKVTVHFDSATQKFPDVTQEYTLKVLENEDATVFGTSDAGYSVLDTLGVDSGGYHFELDEVDGHVGNQVFRSEGVIDQFVDVWLNGQRLTRDVDYFAESGSTKITVLDETFTGKTDEGRNTIAVEYRKSDTNSKNNQTNSNEMSRTSQNFYINKKNSNPQPAPNPDPEPTPDSKPVTNPKPGTSANNGNDGNTVNQNNGQIQTNTKPGTNSSLNKGQMNTGKTAGDKNSSNISSSHNADSDNLSERQDFNGVTLAVVVVNKEGKPLKDHKIEIHSNPLSGTSDETGYVRLGDVEFGNHTLYLFDKGGEELSKASIQIVEGVDYKAEGAKVSAKKGSALKLRIQYDGKTLKLLNVSKDESAPMTATPTLLWLNISVLFISAVGAATLILLRRRCI